MRIYLKCRRYAACDLENIHFTKLTMLGNLTLKRPFHGQSLVKKTVYWTLGHLAATEGDLN